MYLIAFSGGQDSVNLISILSGSSLGARSGGNSPPLARSGGNSPPLARSGGILWCNHLWTIEHFFVLRHCFQLNFFHCQRFFFSVCFSKSFSEQKARSHRYYLFSRIGIYSDSKVICTAHTLNDNIETFFLHLFRGSGKFGLQILRDWQSFSNHEYSKQFY